MFNVDNCMTWIFYAKTIFDEDLDFFSKKIILCAKGGDFKKGALQPL